jgi:predicted AAA+ superfamily ATPase
MNQREQVQKRLENGLETGKVQIVQGCIGLGKTFFVNAWAQSFAQNHPSWVLRQISVDEEHTKSETIFRLLPDKKSPLQRTLLIVDNIDRIDDFSTFVNSINSLSNISCVATSDVNIAMTKSLERTRFADRCTLLSFAPLSYLDYLDLLNGNGPRANSAMDYLRDGGIPSVLLSHDPETAIGEMRNSILSFVEKRFRLNNHVLLANLFDSYCRFGGFTKDKNVHSHNTIAKYTKALVSCFAISELVRVNADYFVALRHSPTYLPLDSCFQTACLSAKRPLLTSAKIAIYNRLISDGCVVSASEVNRQPYENGDRVYCRVETGFLVSKSGRTWFVTFSLDDGTLGRDALKELRYGFPKIIVVLPEVPEQVTKEGFYLVGLAAFLRDGLEIVKRMI